jgi:orotate phosphoribosyltransferase
MKFSVLKEEYIKSLIETNAFTVKSINEEPFVKRNGQKSYMFLDHSRVATSPSAYKSFINAIQALLSERFSDKEFIICNVDSKISAQMVGSVAYNLNKPQIVYKSKELTAIEKGPGRQLTGDLGWSSPVALLDDGVTGGDGTAKSVADLVIKTFPEIENVEIFVGFVRDELKESTYKTHHILALKELIDIIWNDLSIDQKRAIEKEKELQ